MINNLIHILVVFVNEMCRGGCLLGKLLWHNQRNNRTFNLVESTKTDPDFNEQVLIFQT